MTRMVPSLQTLYSPVSLRLAEVERRFDRELYSELPVVNGLCQRVRWYRGKMLRPTLLLLSGDASGEITDEHITLAAVVEMVHVATLVHDDVLDQADVRRQQATVNAAEGNQTAVLLGDYLISHAFHLCSSLDDQYASRRIGATTNTVCEGELMQVHHRGHVELSEADYLEIIRRKTAALTGTCCALGARYAGASFEAVEAWERFGADLGMAFQIVDDLLDCIGTEQQMGKTLGRDLDLGEPTLPVIHALARAEPIIRRQLVSVLRNGQMASRERVRTWLEQTDSIAYAYRVAGEYLAAARGHLATVPPGPSRDSLAAVTDFVLLRQQ